MPLFSPVNLRNMKSGQLLQTIHLAPESVSTATCLRGYSYRVGV